VQPALPTSQLLPRALYSTSAAAALSLPPPFMTIKAAPSHVGPPIGPRPPLQLLSSMPSCPLSRLQLGNRGLQRPQERNLTYSFQCRFHLPAFIVKINKLNLLPASCYCNLISYSSIILFQYCLQGLTDSTDSSNLWRPSGFTFACPLVPRDEFGSGCTVQYVGKALAGALFFPTVS